MLEYEKKKTIVIDVARLIRKHEITIDEFYNALGVSLENGRVEDESVVTELAGIFTGWENNPE